MDRPRRGVFATRSPDCPNPIGLHAVMIETVEENAITIHNLEAIEGTPVLDIKPILGRVNQR
ncbi:MAG TPA: TrmO family methyltransferase [Rubrobacter sp.]|nr:TrmO family methyltransferase [Rubrobacter sp.]